MKETIECDKQQQASRMAPEKLRNRSKASQKKEDQRRQKGLDHFGAKDVRKRGRQNARKRREVLTKGEIENETIRLSPSSFSNSPLI